MMHQFNTYIYRFLNVPAHRAVLKWHKVNPKLTSSMWFRRTMKMASNTVRTEMVSTMKI